MTNSHTQRSSSCTHLLLLLLHLPSFLSVIKSIHYKQLTYKITSRLFRNTWTAAAEGGDSLCLTFAAVPSALLVLLLMM